MCKVLDDYHRDMMKEENIQKIRIMIKKGICEEDILEIGFSEEEYNDAEKELFSHA